MADMVFVIAGLLLMMLYYTSYVGKLSDQAYRDFVFHPFAVRFSSNAEEQYPGFALSAHFLF
jgi:hypothetical protein